MDQASDNRIEAVQGIFGSTVTSGPLWKTLYQYQISVLSCTTFTNFMLQRNTLWQMMGLTNAFYLLLANFTADVIGAIAKSGVSAENTKRLLITANHCDYHERLEQIQFQSNPLVHRVKKYGYISLR